MITHERLKEVLSYDPLTGLWTWLISLNGQTLVGQIAGSIENNGYVRIGIDGERYQAHCLAWLYVTGKWPEVDIDHRDTVRSNNKWTNLRLGTKSQNAMNRSCRSDNRLAIKGVRLSGSGKKPYRATICHEGKKIHIGYFATSELASAAHTLKALELFGEFARVG